MERSSQRAQNRISSHTISHTFVVNSLARQDFKILQPFSLNSVNYLLQSTAKVKRQLLFGMAASLHGAVQADFNA